MPTYSQRERQVLADLLLELGPEAPTLCAGWATRDLAAHLLKRERGLGGTAPDPVDIDAYHATIERWRTGPHGLTIFNLPGVEKRFNLVEHVVHHEDVRRAQPGWKTRELSDNQQNALWAALRVAARLAFRKLDVGVELRRLDGASMTFGSEPRVRITGAPVELLMYASGRREHALVEIDGPSDAVAALAAADLST